MANHYYQRKDGTVRMSSEPKPDEEGKEITEKQFEKALDKINGQFAKDMTELVKKSLK